MYSLTHSGFITDIRGISLTRTIYSEGVRHRIFYSANRDTENDINFSTGLDRATPYFSNAELKITNVLSLNIKLFHHNN